ncbi:MAG: hypothetical protein FD135_2358 [Comamonadaceae bacterium]|nr:MAG: hypothetical protein FD135_2358 [Comamonadaceae bacterium]
MSGMSLGQMIAHGYKTLAQLKPALATWLDTLAATWQNKTLTAPVINGGTIDNAVIGGTTPAAVNATTVSASDGVTSSKNGVAQVVIENTSGTTKNTQVVFKDSVGPRWRVGVDVATNNGTDTLQIYNDTTAAAVGTFSSAAAWAWGVRCSLGGLIQGYYSLTQRFPQYPPTRHLQATYQRLGTLTPSAIRSGNTETPGCQRVG